MTFFWRRDVNLTGLPRKKFIRSVVIPFTIIGAWLFAVGIASAATPPFKQCPAIGLSPSCAVLFTINPDGSITTAVDPSVGPYDGVGGTLVGVPNKTTATTNTSLTPSGS